MMLEQMQRTAMQDECVVEQQKKIVATQFSGYENDKIEDLFDAIESGSVEPQREVIPSG